MKKIIIIFFILTLIISTFVYADTYYFQFTATNQSDTQLHQAVPNSNRATETEHPFGAEAGNVIRHTANVSWIVATLPIDFSVTEGIISFAHHPTVYGYGHNVTAFPIIRAGAVIPGMTYNSYNGSDAWGGSGANATTDINVSDSLITNIKCATTIGEDCYDIGSTRHNITIQNKFWNDCINNKNRCLILFANFGVHCDRGGCSGTNYTNKEGNDSETTTMNWYSGDNADTTLRPIIKITGTFGDSIYPTWSNNQTNSSTYRKNETVQFNITWNDDIDFQSIYFSWNDTGVWINKTNITNIGAVTSYIASFNETITSSKNSEVSWKSYGFDGTNWNETSLFTFTVGNTPPPQITSWDFPITTPYTDNYNITFNWSDVFDIDEDNVSYQFYLNLTTSNSTLIYNNSLSNWTSNFTVEGIYKYIVGTYDGTDYGINSSERIFVFDLSIPTLIISSPLNNTYLNTNINVSLSCSDNIDVFVLNYTFYNSSDVIKSIQNGSSEQTLTINDIIYISSLGQGKYNLNISCSDTHTFKNISDYKITKDIAQIKLNYSTPEKDNIGVKLKSTTATLSDFGTYKTEDRYIFWFNFSQLESYTIYKYVFKLSAVNTLTYLDSSNFNAHFITKYNWITFDFDGDKNYSVESVLGEYEITIYTNKTYLLFKSIGGLNIITKTLNLTIDTLSPSIAFAGGTSLNNSILRQNFVFINVSLIETNFNNITYYLLNSSDVQSSEI